MQKNELFLFIIRIDFQAVLMTLFQGAILCIRFHKINFLNIKNVDKSF